MSATLGPIHFWLYAKIDNQEQLTRAIAELAEEKGWIDSSRPYVKTLEPLEDVIDTANIHGWLQEQITDAETRYACLVSLILSKHGERLKQLYQSARKFGEHHAVEAVSPEAIYKAFDDFFVNGMPCDRINAVTDTAADHLSWEMTQDIHAPYWNGDTAPYYAIRRSVMEGMLNGSGYSLESQDDFHYTIVRK